MEQKLIKSVVKAFDILELLGNSRGEMSLSDISIEMGHNINTVKGLLNTLIHKGYVKQSGIRGGYGLGGRIIYLAESMRMENVLRKIAAPYLQKLHKISGREAVYCSLVSGMQYSYLDYIDCEHELGVHPGKIYTISKDLHVYAQGKLILANSSERDLKHYLKVNPLRSLTSNSITDKAMLDKQLKTIVKTGLAVTKDENSIGIATMASGITDNNGKLIATIAVSLPSSRWEENYKKRLGKILTQYAEEISKKIIQP